MAVARRVELDRAGLARRVELDRAGLARRMELDRAASARRMEVDRAGLARVDERTLGGLVANGHRENLSQQPALKGGHRRVVAEDLRGGVRLVMSKIVIRKVLDFPVPVLRGAVDAGAE